MLRFPGAGRGLGWAPRASAAGLSALGRAPRGGVALEPRSPDQGLRLQGAPGWGVPGSDYHQFGRIRIRLWMGEVRSRNVHSWDQLKSSDRA